jgi:hypothetical protein
MQQTTTPLSGMSTLSMIDSTAMAVPATQPSADNTAVIGGIVVGVVALFLIVGLIAFIMSRKAANNQPPQENGAPKAPGNPPASNYGNINVQPLQNQYDESFLKHSPANQQYDDAGVLANNNYDIVANANANQPNYDDPSVLSH